jgi:hypothetical protein
MATAHQKIGPAPEHHLIQGDGFSLHVHPAVLVRLDALVREGFELLPKGGLETGGLLLGSIGSSELWIDEIEPVPIEHRWGPSYQLSDSEIETFRQIIHSSAVPPPARAIGHFRSHARGEIAINSTDLTIATLAPAPVHFVLLIKGSRFEPRIAQLFRKRGENCVELLQFPLDFDPAKVRSIVPQPALPKPAPIAEPLVAATPAPEPPPEPLPAVSLPAAPLPAVSLPASPRLRGTQVVIGALIFCLLVAVSAGLYSRTTTPAAELGLKARRSDQSVTVSWNHSSPAVMQAALGVLTIQDGDSQKQLRFDPVQLRASNVVYVPQTPRVQFRLEVFRDRDHFSGEAVSIDTGLTASLARPAKTESAERVIVSRADPPTPQERARTQPGNAAVRNPDPPARPLSARLQFRPVEASPVSKTAPAGLPQPPSASPAEVSSPVGSAPPILGPPRVAPPSQPATAPAASPSPPSPVEPASIPIIYSDPVATRKILPQFPTNFRFAIKDRVSVDVKVTIDATGKVVSAAPVNATTPPQKLLTPLAAQTALRWQFEPAKRNGQPVASETVITFKFEPSGR